MSLDFSNNEAQSQPLMNNITTVAEYLRNTVDWNKFYSLVDTLGKTLNAPKDRFEKSDLMETALASFSKNEEIEYVNRNGVDHLLPKIGTNLEMKYSASSLYSILKAKTNPKISLKSKISSIRLVNTNSNKIPSCLPSGYADFLLIADIHGAFVLNRETLQEHIFFGSGFIEARNIPMTKAAIVVGPESGLKRNMLTDFNYKEAKRQFQLDFLKKF